MRLLDVCDNEEDHFVIAMKELATGDIYNVECLCDLGLFYTGYKPGYSILFKDQWQIVREPEPVPASERENAWYVPTAFAGVLVLGLIIGCILNLVGR